MISPLLANIYLHYLDKTWEERGYQRREGPNVQLVRYADDVVLLTNKDAHWAMKRLEEILGSLELKLNVDKSRVVDACMEPGSDEACDTVFALEEIAETAAREGEAHTGSTASCFHP